MWLEWINTAWSKRPFPVNRMSLHFKWRNINVRIFHRWAKTKLASDPLEPPTVPMSDIVPPHFGDARRCPPTAKFITSHRYTTISLDFRRHRALEGTRACFQSHAVCPALIAGIASSCDRNIYQPKTKNSNTQKILESPLQPSNMAAHGDFYFILLLVMIPSLQTNTVQRGVIVRQRKILRDIGLIKGDKWYEKEDGPLAIRRPFSRQKVVTPPPQWQWWQADQTLLAPCPMVMTAACRLRGGPHSGIR